MVNFHDPAVIVQDSLTATKLWHSVCGLYIWEFITTLEYEWEFIRGRRPYRWTILPYCLARAAALASVILGLVMMDNSSPMNCQVATTIHVILAFLTLSASSLLIVLRIIAIWDRNKIIMATAISLWVINVGVLIQDGARLRSAWAPAQLKCVPSNTNINLPYVISMLATDIALLLMMLIGLFRLRYYDNGVFSLVRFLWKQGVTWLFVAVVAEVPPVALAFLNLNAPLNLMFQPPSWITMAITATRMYRSLTEFVSGSTEMYDIPLSLAFFPSSKSMSDSATSVRRNQVEIIVDTDNV